MSTYTTHCRIRAAKKDYSARGGRREHWFRFAYIDGQWTYDWAEERLGAVGHLASDRKQTTHGDVPVGTLIAQHDRGGRIDAVGVAIASKPCDDCDELEAVQGAIVWCSFARRAGNLVIEVPFVGRVTLDDPRRSRR